MSVNWGLHDTRATLHGNTKRDRDISKLKSDIINNAVNSASYKEITIDGVANHIIVNSTQDPYVKTFACMPDDDIPSGTLIKMANNNWLVTSADPDDEIYVDGKIEYCNYTLKFIGSTNQIVSRPCIVENATKYNSGVKQDKYMILGTSQYLIRMPFDRETKLLDRTYPDGTNRRLLMDIGTSEPCAYTLSQVDRITYPGIISLTLTETVRSDNDSIDLMVADYNRITPALSTNDVAIKYSGLSIVEVGKGFKTFTVESDTEFTPIWDVITIGEEYDPYVITETANNYIKIKVTNPAMIGMPLTLQVRNSESTVFASLVLEVKSIG